MQDFVLTEYAGPQFHILGPPEAQSDEIARLGSHYRGMIDVHPASLCAVRGARHALPSHFTQIQFDDCLLMPFAADGARKEAKKMRSRKVFFVLGALMLVVLAMSCRVEPDTPVEPVEKILLGGSFATVGGNAHANIARLNADGTEDTSFTIGTNGRVYVIKPYLKE